MKETTELGRLRRIDVRAYWENEAGEFTPWLADEQNIGLLGETIRLELEVRSQEQSVGPFRADIVCVDTVSGRTVLIENQLERTDHSHLGQLLTYAAGLDAIVIVWIAQRFTDEHRAAVDWLNRITDDSVSFFGLEIELWQIGNSPPAPKFNMVAKPNEWTKPPLPPPLTDTQRLYREYWTALREHLEASKSSIRMGKPQPQTWMTFPVGRNYFYLTAAISKTKKSIAVYLVIYGSDRLAHFHLLQRQESEIKERLGLDLEWREMPEKKESQIRRTLKDIDPADKGDWPRQHEIIRQGLEEFHDALSSRVKSLDAGEWEPEEVEA